MKVLRKWLLLVLMFVLSLTFGAIGIAAAFYFETAWAVVPFLLFAAGCAWLAARL